MKRAAMYLLDHVAQALVAVLVTALVTWFFVKDPDPENVREVPAVYNMRLEAGLEELSGDGFTAVATAVVCSSSVEEGRIREVVRDNAARPSDEIAYITEDGASEARLPLTTKLLVKVSNGQPCA